MSNFKCQISNWKLEIINSLRRRAGFTLVELLIAIVIIGIIASIGYSSYNSAQMRARDAKRKQDLRSISVALELYYQKNKHYPCSSDWQLSSSADSLWIKDEVVIGVTSCGSTPFNTNYINSLPKDPLRNSGNPQGGVENGYAYWAASTVGFTGCPGASGQFYNLTTLLENSNDPDRNEIRDPKFCDGNGAFSTYNYPKNTFTIYP